MDIGDKVKFSLYDSLTRDVLYLTGTIKDHIWGGLWLIKPCKHPRLSGGDIQVHEECVFAYE